MSSVSCLQNISQFKYITSNCTVCHTYADEITKSPLFVTLKAYHSSNVSHQTSSLSLKIHTKFNSMSIQNTYLQDTNLTNTLVYFLLLMSFFISKMHYKLQN